MLRDNVKSINQNISWQEWKLSIPAIIRGTAVGSTNSSWFGASVASFLHLTKKQRKILQDLERAQF